MFLLHTSAVIHFFKGQGRVAERPLAVSPSEVALPSLVVFELTVGVLRLGDPAGRRARLEPGGGT